MKLYNLLLEILSGDESYHRTTISNMFKIIKSDKIFLSTDLTNPLDIIGKDRFFLSLSRTRNPKLGFVIRMNSVGVIVFDTKKLNSNFKSRPYNYYSNMEDISKITDFEYEDRIIYHKSYIDNISKYIKRIDIITNLDIKEISTMYNLLLSAQEKKIPIFFYKNINDLIKQKNNVNDKLIEIGMQDNLNVNHTNNTNDVAGSEEYYSNLIAILFLEKPYESLENSVNNFAERRSILDKIDINKIKFFYNLYKNTDSDENIEMDNPYGLTDFIGEYLDKNLETPFRELLHVLNKQMRQYKVKWIGDLISAKID